MQPKVSSMGYGKPTSLFKRASALIGILCLALLLLGMTVWGTLAIYYSGPSSNALRTGLAIGFAVCALAALVGLAFQRWRWRALTGFLVIFAGLLVWWSTIHPSNDRDWQPDVAVLPWATINGDLITVHNIRNFSYRSETEFTPAYYDKTFKLHELESVDLIASYWMGPAIAHTFLSFGFRGGDYLAISIETRKERNEDYSTVKGFFKRYELYYVVADERDVIRVRTNYRRDPPEDVYLYRIYSPVENARRLFLEYIRAMNAVKDKPQFYNTLTTNCTTGIWLHTRINPGHLPFSWKLLLSGYVPEYVYEHHRLDNRLPFDELKRRSHINARAQAADTAKDFSQRIRTGVIAP
jgi:hypothetical protein